RSPDGKLAGEHRAEISLDAETGRYRWYLSAVLRSMASAPMALKWLEYTNVYPAGTGRCMLFTPQKRYDRTILTAADGQAWEFPHQHTLHYTVKINDLSFAVGSLGGFFLEELNPVVIVQEATMPPDWAICDMYYDLHCGARPAGEIAPGAEHRFIAEIKYLDRQEAEPLVQRARRVPITAEDYRRYHFPRLALGRNDFSAVIGIDRADDASAFRVEPPEKTWDRNIGAAGKGALRLYNATAKETVWSAAPPTQIPAQHRLRLAALAKTEGVEGKGLFLRVRYHTFVWRPQPHVEWVKTLESEPLRGTTREWQAIEVPALEVPAEHFDYLIWIDVVLDGRGTAWLTDMDVDLQPTGVEVPLVPEDIPTGSRSPAKL
ncbi:MAG: hypothetical protein N3A66_06540, partial [Planctomycetota bacterium]|nr:hypothetical protein [Planctomycetota bacterium]